MKQFPHFVNPWSEIIQNMTSPSKFDMDECLDEIRTYEGMVFPKHYMIRSITRKNKKYKKKLIRIMLSKCEDLEEHLEESDPGKFSLSEIKKTYDLPLILNYYKVLLNIPIWAEKKRLSRRRSPEEHRAPPSGNAGTHKELRDKVSFYLVPQELDLDDALNKLQEDLENLKRPEDREWLFEFSKRAVICIETFSVRNHRVDNRRELGAQNGFFLYIGSPIQALLSSFGVELEMSMERVAIQTYKKESRIGSDIVFEDEYNDRFETFIEMRHEGLHLFAEMDYQGNLTDPRRLARPFMLPQGHCNKLHSNLFQQASYFTGYETCIYVTSDYHTSYFNRLAFDYEGWQQTDQESIPIETVIIDIDDSGLTAAIIWGAHHRTEAEIERDNQSLVKLANLIRRAWPTEDSSSPTSSRPSSSGTDFSGGTTFSGSAFSGTLPSGTSFGKSGPRSGDTQDPSSDRNILIYKGRGNSRNGAQDQNILRYTEENLEYVSSYQNSEYLASFEDPDHSVVHYSDLRTIGKFQRLQEDPDHSSIVLYFETKDLKHFFPDIELKSVDPHSEVVMKIYDYRHLDTYLMEHNDGFYPPYLEYVRSCHNRLLKEIECYRKIWEYNNKVPESEKIRIPVFHNYGNMELTPKGYPNFYKGFFTVVDYAGEKVQRITEDQYKDGVVQLQRMGEIGVEYTDVALRNLRVKNDKLVFIDFDSCDVYDHPVSNEYGIELLEECL